MDIYLDSTPVPLRVSIVEAVRVIFDLSLPCPSRMISGRYLRVILQYLYNVTECPHQLTVFQSLYNLTFLQVDFEPRSHEFLQQLHDEVVRDDADPYFVSLWHSVATAVETALGDYQHYGRYIRD